MLLCFYFLLWLNKNFCLGKSPGGENWEFKNFAHRKSLCIHDGKRRNGARLHTVDQSVIFTFMKWLWCFSFCIFIALRMTRECALYCLSFFIISCDTLSNRNNCLWFEMTVPDYIVVIVDNSEEDWTGMLMLLIVFDEQLLQGIFLALECQHYRTSTYFS